MDSPRLKPNTKATKTPELPRPLAMAEVSSKPGAPSKTTAKNAAKTVAEALARLLEQYEYGPIEFAGSSNASYERHLVFTTSILCEQPHRASALRVSLARYEISCRNAGSARKKLRTLARIPSVFITFPWSILSGERWRGAIRGKKATTDFRRNHGVVASCSRGLVEGLSAQQLEAEYNAAPDAAIQSIFEASSMNLNGDNR
jgi:hypothetical protein